MPSIEGEFARKRRMMSHAWPIVLHGGLLSPRGYPPLYALMMVSHRVLRYAAPFVHVVPLIVTLLAGDDAVLRDRLRAAARVAARRAARPPRADQTAAGRALLRADDRLRRRRPVGLLAPRHARRVGAGGRDAVLARRAFDMLSPRPASR